MSVKTPELLNTIKPNGFGLIARTACEGGPKDKIKTEMDFLIKLYNNIQQKMPRAPIPSLIHQDLNITLRAVRDLFTRKWTASLSIYGQYEQIMQFIDTFMPKLEHLVHLYEEREPLFDGYGIEVEVGRSSDKEVSLKSGGYIVIEATEALTSDQCRHRPVRGAEKSGRNHSKHQSGGRQGDRLPVALRNIGGLVVIDFIDMEKRETGKKILRCPEEALSGINKPTC